MTKIKLLTDEPTDKDDFGSHTRVANGLCSILKNQREMRVIGLLGPWGSGKSSVVKQACAQMRESGDADNILFFEYDAWLHQSDNPRRSFLEALTSFLLADQRSIIAYEDWEDELDSLAGRHEDTEVETTSSLSKSGKVAAFSAALIPVGLALVDFQIVKEALGIVTQNADTNTASLFLAIGLLCLMAPVIAIGVLWLLWRPWSRSWRTYGLRLLFKKDFWTSRAKRFERESLISLVSQTHKENVKHKVRISPEPTSIEFQKMLRKLMDAVGRKQLQLVCIIDNLDRLEADDAIRLWSTMRILFLGANRDEMQVGSPTVIVPLDDSALKKLFERNGHVENGRALSFTDKTFDVTLSVGLPITSGWRAFLNSQLKASFGNLISENEVYWVTKLIEQQSDRRQFEVTPRRINKHINSIATLWLQRTNPVISLTSFSFYSMFKEKIETDGILAFLSSDIQWVGPKEVDWRRDIAAIHHGVDTDIAFQIVLEDPLRSAIRTEDFEAFSEGAQTPGSWPVIERICTSPPEAAEGGLDPDFIRSATLLLSEIETERDVERRQCFQALAAHYLDSADPSEYPEHLVKFAEIAVSQDGVDRQAILNRLASQISGAFSAGDIAEKTVEQFSKDALSLIELAKDKGVNSPIFSFEGALSRLFLVLSELKSSQLLAFININVKADEIVPALVEAFNDADRVSDVAGAVKALSNDPRPSIQNQKKNLGWQPLLDQAGTILQNNEIDHSSMQTAIDILGVLYENSKAAKEKFEQILSSGQIQNRLNEADNKESVQKLADLSAILLFNQKDFSPPNNQTWAGIAEKYSDYVEKVENSIIWYQKHVDLELLHRSVSKAPSYKEIARMLFDKTSKGAHSRVSTRYFVQNYDALGDEFGIEGAKSLLSKLQKRDNFWEEYKKLGFGPGIERISMDISSLGDDEHQNIRNHFEEQLRGLDEATWDGLIKNGGYELDVATAFKKRFGNTLTLTGALPNALDLNVSDVAQSDNPDLRRNWFVGCALISSSTRSTKLKKVRDKILNGSTIANLVSLMEIGGGDFLTGAQFASDSNGTVIYIVEPLIKLPNGRAWLEKYHKEILDILGNCSSDSLGTVIETLSVTHDEADDDGKISISDLADALGLPRSKKQENQKQDDGEGEVG